MKYTAVNQPPGQPSHLNTPFLKLKRVAALLILSSLSLGSVAQTLSLPCDEAEEKVKAQTSEGEVALISAFQPARPLKRIDPEYPVEAAKRGQEGWVQMSYVIDEEGRVQDPVIEDFSGSRAFKRKALNAIKRWTFEPAMKDGKPTQQCHQAVQFDFALGGKRGATRSFIQKYKEIDAIYRTGNFAKADEALLRLKDDNTLNRYENAWLWNLDAQIASGLKDWSRELSSYSRMLPSHRGIGKGDNVFGDEHIAFVHQRMGLIASQLGQFANALTYFDRLSAMENQQKRLEEIKPLLEEINAHINSDTALNVPVTIKEQGSWFHTLIRHQFAFANIEGELDTVEVRCESHREKFTVAEDHIWHIPPSWGQCRVLVEGKDSTKFNLVEIAGS